MNKSLKIFLIVGIILSVSAFTNAQTNTVGLIMNDSTASFGGYTLFSPLSSTNTYLINNDGYVVHSWSSNYRPGQAVMLLPDGSLLRTAAIGNSNIFDAGGAGGRVEKYDWDGNLTWSFDYYSSDYSTHHDVEYMPNGNILLIAWEKKSFDDAVAAGRNPSNIGNDIWPEKIIEVKPTGTSGGEIVWQWHVWDHLIQDFDSTKANYGSVANHPELIDFNFGSSDEDWLHINSVRYNSERDEILLSVHNFSEIWIIDHSTTTEQAAGHSGGGKSRGGDLLYRWGNPQAYRAGTSLDRKLFTQHDARWIESGLPGEGDIMIFNNGQGRTGGNYSSVDQITPPLDSNNNYYLDSSGKYGPGKLTWTYTAQPSTSFYGQNISGATRMPNGNTLICEGPSGKFFEVNGSGKTVWEYINPVTRNGILMQGETPTANPVFKVYRYSPNYSGLVGKDLSPKGRIETYTTGVESESSLPQKFSLEQNYPNPFNPATTIKYSIPNVETQHAASHLQHVTLKIYNVIGQEITTLVDEQKPPGNYEISFDAGKLTSGVYLYSIKTNGFSQTKKMLLLK